MNLVLGIDVGTQGVRVVAADASGHIIAQAKRPFARVTLPGLAPGQLEQDPADWWEATRDCLRDLTGQLRQAGHAAEEIVAGAVDSTSGTVVLLDADHRPLRPALMYNDRRAGAETEIVNAASEADYPILGYRFNSSFALPKILWLQRHEPDVWARGRRIVHAADYIVGRLTGRFDLSDPSNALKTGFDLLNFRWPPFMQGLGLDEGWMPQIVRTGEPIAPISRECASDTGLSERTRMVAGMTDGCADQIAAGAREVGDWNTVVGTTLIFKGLTRERVLDPLGRVYSHLHPMGYWMPGGASNTGARVLDERFPKADREALGRAALSLSPTPLTLYPLLQKGERFPFNQPDAEGFAEGQPEGEAEWYAAHLEGLAYVERLGYEVLQSLGAPGAKRIYTTGGGAQSVEWMQIRADVLNAELARAANANAAMGSAIIAASQTLFDNLVAACAEMVQVDCTVIPRPERVPRYAEGYARFLSACRRRGYLEQATAP